MIKNQIIKIQRFFYPIGQGAFYAEKHQIGDKKFTIVYDCGTCRTCKAGQLKSADNVIEKAFKKNEQIDILFISHFDYDHVSKIKKLKEHTTIKKVIMPLLHKSEKYLLSNMYRVLKFRNIIPLLENPEKFFGKETDIIRVKSTNRNETETDRIEIEFEPIVLSDEMNGIELESEQSLKIDNNYNWVFIPYNYEYKNRHQELVKKFKEVGFTNEDIKSLQDGATIWIPEQIRRNEKSLLFKTIYNSLTKHGKNTSINENSMLLYSGIVTASNLIKQNYLFDLNKNIRWHEILEKTDRVSCIYTGDTTLSVVDIKSVFRYFWNSVGTIQIPHHGDKGSFKKNILSNKNYCCPISVGTNHYGHPSKNVITDIISQNSYPILVSEDLSSGFIEYIYTKC